jgi:hypothetical protein
LSGDNVFNSDSSALTSPSQDDQRPGLSGNYNGIDAEDVPESNCSGLPSVVDSIPAAQDVLSAAADMVIGEVPSLDEALADELAVALHVGPGEPVTDPPEGRQVPDSTVTDTVLEEAETWLAFPPGQGSGEGPINAEPPDPDSASTHAEPREFDAVEEDIRRMDLQVRPSPHMNGLEAFSVHLTVSEVSAEREIVPSVQAPVDLGVHEAVVVGHVVRALNDYFSDNGAIFTNIRPGRGTEYSTIFIGGNDTAFAQYGSFLGLAEQVDDGNLDRGDNAVVFSDKLNEWRDWTSAAYETAVVELIAHEAAHLLGYAHEQPPQQQGAILADVAVTAAEVNGVPQWTEEGPSTILSDTAPNNGAIQAVLAHPGDANTVYVGTVNGGVWRSTNVFDAQTDPTRIQESFNSLNLANMTAVGPCCWPSFLQRSSPF